MTCISHLIVAPRDAVAAVARSGELHGPHCDCNGVNAIEVMIELGCTPELVYTSAPLGSESLLLYRVPDQQVEQLAALDYAALADINELIRKAAHAILLPRDNRLRSELYGKAVEIARTAVELHQSLFARVQYVDRRTAS